MFEHGKAHAIGIYVIKNVDITLGNYFPEKFSTLCDSLYLHSYTNKRNGIPQ